jgi:hypothetical protein
MHREYIFRTSHDDVIEELKRGLIFNAQRVHFPKPFCNDRLQQWWYRGCPLLINGTVVPECRNIHIMIENIQEPE